MDNANATQNTVSELNSIFEDFKFSEYDTDGEDTVEDVSDEEVAETETDDTEDHDSEEVDSDEDLEDEDSDDEDEDSDDEEEDEDDVSPIEIDDKEFAVIVNGEEVIVKGSELKNGYMRQADYSRKTAEVAKERKAVIEAKEQVAESANLFKFTAKKQLEETDALIAQYGGWANLKANLRPEEVEGLSLSYQDAQSRAKLADDFLQTYEVEKQNNLKSLQENALVEFFKTTSGVTMDTLTEMQEYALSQGATVKELDGITTPFQLRTILKAMQSDKIKSRPKTSTKPNKSKVIVNKSTRTDTSSTPSKKLDKALDAVKSSRSIHESRDSVKDALNLIFKK